MSLAIFALCDGKCFFLCFRKVWFTFFNWNSSWTGSLMRFVDSKTPSDNHVLWALIVKAPNTAFNSIETIVTEWNYFTTWKWSQFRNMPIFFSHSNIINSSSFFSPICRHTNFLSSTKWMRYYFQQRGKEFYTHLLNAEHLAIHVTDPGKCIAAALDVTWCTLSSTIHLLNIDESLKVGHGLKKGSRVDLRSLIQYITLLSKAWQFTCNLLSYI